MQRVTHVCTDATRVLEVPSPSANVMPGVRWGRVDQAFSPAFWKAQTWLEGLSGLRPNFRIGQTLEEETVACLLGGYGIPAEVGLSAFKRLRDEGLIRLPPPKQAVIQRQLLRPLVMRGRRVHYRFAAQKSRYIAGALEALRQSRPDATSGLRFRSWFLRVTGIGPKTASWITRNWLACDEVAIIDIHVLRAMALAGVVALDSSAQGSYFGLERCFLNFSSAIEERPSFLDAVIWRQMRLAGSLVRWGLSTRPSSANRQVA
jgi:N-glycosylase/DNA lyase